SVGLFWQRGYEKGPAAACHGIPADGAVDLGKLDENLETVHEIELEPALAPRHEKSEHADGPQGRHYIRGNATLAFHLAGAGGDARRQIPDVAEQPTCDACACCARVKHSISFLSPQIGAVSLIAAGIRITSVFPASRTARRGCRLCPLQWPSCRSFGA